MRRYLLGRLAQAVFAIWATYTVTFIILYMLPSDPIAVMLNSEGDGTYVDPARVDALTTKYGFDQPIPVQYVTRLFAAFTGDFGDSVQTGQPVLAAILDVLPDTLALASWGLLLAVLLGCAISVLGELTRFRWIATALRNLPPLGASIPVFWIGLMLLQVFSFRLGWLPAVGNEGAASLVLPVITLAIPSSASIAQVLTRNLEDADREPYVDTARATGASRWRIVIRHSLRNAALPTVTILGLTVGGLLAGSVVTETVFSRAGIGRLTQTAVAAQDIPLVQGVVVLSAFIFVAVNLVVDLLYPLFDPRVRRARSQA